MKIGYYVQGDNDEALIWGLAQRWCPNAERAPGKFRGSSGESFRREIRNALVDLKDDKGCDILAVLTDADANPWREVKRREWQKVPVEHQHLTIFGVADRNVECWLAIDRQALAAELQCQVNDIPQEDPSGFLKRQLGYGQRGADKQAIKDRVRDFIAGAPLRSWIEGSDSFEDFYQGARRLAQQTECVIPNELEHT